MFAQPNYTFTESEVVGRVEVITGGPVPADFQVRVTGGNQIVINTFLYVVQSITVQYLLTFKSV